MTIILTNKAGVILKTEEKLCAENILVVPKLETKNITANGTYSTSEGFAGTGTINVNVPVGETVEVYDGTITIA